LKKSELLGILIFFFLISDNKTLKCFHPVGLHSKRMTGRQSTDKSDDPVRSRGTTIFPGERNVQHCSCVSN